MMAGQKEAMAWGAIAGAVTVLTETLTIDPASLIKDFDPIVFLGYCVKAIILMTLGAIVVRVNQELNILKAFQLGIMAPALIVGIQSGSKLKDANKELLIARDQIQQLQAKDINPGLVSTVDSTINFCFLIANLVSHEFYPI